MADEGFKRKLAAILSADVEGYSRLMDDDEEATVRTLTSYRNAITDLVQQFRGRVVDAPGDNLLAEFTSVVDAVNCAVEIQRELAERNEELPDHRKMQFRIGVNLGDVIDEDGRIYGDGVNIAARVESLADAGGICISGRAHDQVENKLGLEYEDLGKHEVKNISRPIQVYRVLSYPGAAAHRVVQAKETLGRKWRKIGFAVAIAIVAVAIGVWQFYSRGPSVEPASVEKMAFPLPEKPSIAVLPFANMSDDTGKEYLSDGITEQIITSLSKLPRLFVISRTSTFSYKDKPVKVQQVAEELGVRYVLEGSFQQSGDKIRITAQLIDAITGRHMWAKRYDRDYKNIFALQNEITLKILNEIGIKLTAGESIRAHIKKPTSLEAYEKLMEGSTYLRAFNIEGNNQARRLAKEIIALDPEYSRGYNLLALTKIMDFYFGTSKSPPKTLAEATKLLQKAIALDETDSAPYSYLCHVLGLQRQYDMAVEMGQKAIELNPNSDPALMWLATVLEWMGKPGEAIELSLRAMRLCPFPPAWYYMNLGHNYRAAGECEKAIIEYKKALHLTPKNLLVLSGTAVCYGLLGMDEKSQAAVAEIEKLNPKYNIKHFKKSNYMRKDQELVIRWAEVLRKAGLPDKPPLPLPDKPSIAVLAFDNLSGDPEQEYFGDGIAENIITALSKVGELFVIARNSSFTYKGKPVKVQQVGRELGVRYVLEGSVQKSGDRVRITAQLIDAKNGQHLWAENYDRDLQDIFEIQDELTMKIVTALRVELTEGERARILAKKIKSPEVYLKVAKAQSAWREGTQEGTIQWGQLAQEIVDLEPEAAIGYRLLGWYHYRLANWGVSPRENFKKAVTFSQKAFALDQSDSFTHAQLSYIYLFMKKYDKAIESGRRSVELAPNEAEVKAMLGGTLCDAGQLDEGIAYIKQGLRLDPFPAFWYHTKLSDCYLQKRLYENALAEIKKSLQRAPGSPIPYFGLAVTYILLDRDEEARASATKCIELMPNISVSFYSKISANKNQAYKELIMDAMRKAGFPEGT